MSTGAPLQQVVIGKRIKVGRVQLTSDLTSAINPQPHVRDFLRPNQPLYLVDTSTSASILGYNMLSNQEKIDMLDINNDPVQVLPVDGNDIKVYGKLYRTVGIDDKLHRHLFLVTALP